MKRNSLRGILTLRFALFVLAVILLISVAANLLINRQFESYVKEQQSAQATELAQHISQQYDSASGGWNPDYIHGLGMYALNEGYILKLYDRNEDVVWDAEHHDMTLCHQMMENISLRMAENRPGLQGDFVTHRFDLEKDQQVVGYLDVSYYGPYSLTESDFHFLSSLNRILVLVGLVSLVGAVVMGGLLANSLARPVEKIGKLTQRISNGDYTIRFQEPVRARELFQLAQAVNHMAAALEKQETLRKRLTADVAHELRTPLGNVSSYLEAILEGVWEPTPERLKNCYDELERLSSLVLSLEQLRQVEAETPNLQKERVDLLELAQSTAMGFETQLAAKHLRCSVDGTHGVVLADRDRMQQVLTNLMSNAVKYSNEAGAIRVGVEETEDTVRLWVEDEGIGIAEKECDLIFERFYRTDTSRNRKTGGAGIGLSIVKTIVQAHGGAITVKSQEGKGSRFTVTLPKE